MTLDWGLLISTYNRGEILIESVRLALGQSRPPVEAIVIDAGDDWERNRDAIAPIAAAAGVPLRYEPACERSLPAQRNQAIALATADILFMIDDDSFLFPDSAVEMMAVYEADTDGDVAAIGLRGVDDNPSGAELSLARKRTGHDVVGDLGKTPLVKRAIRLFYRKVLMMAHEETFLTYDTARFSTPQPPAAMAGQDVRAVNHIPGYSMTVRRAAALAEPFDGILKYYAALEDADASHRFRRHGALLVARRARVHHYQTSASRLPRDKVIILQLLNLAIFLRRHSPMLDLKRRQYRVMLWRRLVAEAFKDALSLRLGFPQVRGVMRVMGMRRAFFDAPAKALYAWYPEFQRRLIEDGVYASLPEASPAEGGAP